MGLLGIDITMSFLINWSTSELNTQMNPATCLGDKGCWIQQVTAPTLVVTCWIHQCTCILLSTCTKGGFGKLSVADGTFRDEVQRFHSHSDTNIRTDDNWLSSWIANPNSSWRHVWDVLSA